MFSIAINTLEERAAFVALFARRSGHGSPDSPLAFAQRPAVGAQVRVRGWQVVSHMPAMTIAPIARDVGFGLSLDIAALAGAFAQRLQEADADAFTRAQCESYSDALREHVPPSRRALYHMTKATFVTGQEHAATFDRVFTEVFGPPLAADRPRERELAGAGA